MCNILKVRWTINPRTAPKPWIACSGCGCHKPFKSSGKIRLNANGKKLDAWLIYKCVDCDKTWNRTLFERQAIRDLNPATLEALQGNDPEWIRAREFDLDALRSKVQRVDEFADADVQREVLRETDSGSVLEIDLAIALLSACASIACSHLNWASHDPGFRLCTNARNFCSIRIAPISCGAGSKTARALPSTCPAKPIDT